MNFKHIDACYAFFINDTSRMNNQNKYYLTRQMNHQAADLIASASLFLFFSTTNFLKINLTSRTIGKFGFVPTHEVNAAQNLKIHFFAKASTNQKN